MVEPGDVGRVLLDAARLVRDGEIVVFGSAALAMWLSNAPRTKDVDVWCAPADRGDIVEAVMGELSWYHEKHGVFVEVWAPETFAAPTDWPSRARRLDEESVPGVTLVVPHPHDVLLAKLERWDDSDRAHAARILAEIPMSRDRLEALAAQSPYRQGSVSEPERIRAFEAHLQDLFAQI